MWSVVRTVLVVFAVAGLAALPAACGESAPDEFTGTWRQVDSGDVWTVPLVIAPSDEGYQATLVFSEAQPTFELVRQVDRLSGTMEIGAGIVPVEIVYEPQSGHITVSIATEPGGEVTNPTEFTRTSTSTAIVTPSPF